MAYDYELISVEIEEGVAFATVDNPPINIITLPLFRELAELSQEIEADDAVRVFVLKSANPEFFLAHFDVEALLQSPTDGAAERTQELGIYHAMCERYRTMPKATIAQIEGRVGGGGSELASSFDMRFGVRGKTKINQMEVPLGILPGGTGTQRLPRLVGRGRALEIILAGDDLDAESAEQWGYLNRALFPDQIGPFVTSLAKRNASFPPEAVRLAKASVDAADKPLREGLLEEAYLFQILMRTDDAQKNMKRFLELGGQTREGELEVNELSRRLGQDV
ncbi:MAG: enoyl-CoA hydratase/isomerase family protein [Gammaproteobacteria bacterium]